MKKLIRRVKSLYCGYRSILKQYVFPYDYGRYGELGDYSLIQNNSSLVQENIFADDYVIIQDKTNFISYHGKLIIGKYSVISSGCTIVPGAHKLTVGVPFYLATRNHINDEEGNIIIEEDCWIGAGCILLPKCRIGRGAVVGAGSVVKKDVPPYAVVVGVPAKIIATKFTVEQIIRHEAILYPPEERLTKTQLDTLFRDYYKELKSIGVETLSDDDIIKLEVARASFGIKDYSKE